jgi:hypothetical protein
VLLALATMGFGYSRFKPPEEPASGLSAGAQTSVDPSGATNLVRNGDPIPPPEPMEAVAPVKAVRKAEPGVVPNAAPATEAHAPEVSFPVPEALSSSPSPPPPAPPPPVPAAKKPTNKSEVF